MQASQWWGPALLRALATHIKVNRNVLSTFRRNCGIAHFCQMANRDSGTPRIRRVDAKCVSDIADSSSDQLARDDADYYFAADDGLETQPSTFEDEEKVKRLLKEILAYRDTNVSNWIVESKVKHLCAAYKYLLKPHRDGFLKVLACDYAVDHSMVNRAAKLLVGLELAEQPDQRQVLKGEERLKQLLTPQYSWLFIHMGRMEQGVKFMVDLRTDVLTLISETTAADAALLPLQMLNNTLREMLSLWFSVGFLNLERITWRSSCEMLQKISEYEAVHPVRNWTDLKRRVGPYRRCFVYTHSSMPYEPLVVLHTALSDEIARSIRGIVSAASRMSVDAAAGQKILDSQAEDPSVIKAAIFYSITSTQKGLQGIELGNYLIKRVVRELQAELPLVNKFSSLSPIPNFRVWLVEKLKSADKAEPDMFTKEELERLKSHLKEEDIPGALRRVLKTNSWVNDPPLMSMLEGPLMRLCARYLYLEKRRGFALDSVANFHLRNGAMMWRLNWQADLSPRGLGNSCGIMVNYRYFLEDTESNSRMYLERQHIAASEQVQKLATGARELMDKVTSKM